jgi:predicted transcriptional regulator
LLILCRFTTHVLRKSDKTKLVDFPHANVCRIVWVSDQNAHKVHSIMHTLVMFESKPASHAFGFFLHRYLLLDETLNQVQIVGAVVTLASIYLINKRTISNNDGEAKS